METTKTTYQKRALIKISRLIDNLNDLRSHIEEGGDLDMTADIASGQSTLLDDIVKALEADAADRG